ncbi:MULTISPECIES: sterol desaturase family protein [Leptospira]|uniref:Fatty acid hydroxylase family protein n=1 Tax=Leptospira weilii str. Ecochallenge TaxID=1049986 RepID=N1UB20_9LEPT|nr:MULTISPECIES: sterol desaturase family protein [Leptospira]EMJ62791.1 fatty acid hydroxylase family protein [Leptospira sp. P2653]EMY16302.1 fatty acid hydroxylase family protein [Leptospira weilii str. Ecochallenge]ULH27492.1 sterol desaturase family protein [Leptospira weilii]
MQGSILDLAVPFFLVLIGLEVFYSRVIGKKVYRWNDTVADLSTGVLFSLTGILVTVVSLWIYEKFRIFCSLQVIFGIPEIPLGAPFLLENGSIQIRFRNLTGWIFVFLMVDFVYYWFHRATHEINFLWACHVTHHSSEEFNLAVALRQSSFQRVFEYTFNLLIAFCGVPWQAFLLAHGILKIYQFWVHTRLIGKLGFLEEILVTPAHHRVHHGRDPKYIDKNHGGILIFWDRIFGSFAREEEEPIYGLTKPVTTFDPVYTNLHVYEEIFSLIQKTKSFKEKVLVLLKPPGWRPTSLGPSILPQEIDRSRYEKFDPIVSDQKTVLGVLEFLLWTVLSLLLLKFFRSGNLVLWKIIPVIAYIFYGFKHTGFVLDGSPRGRFRIAFLLLGGIVLSWILFFV